MTYAIELRKSARKDYLALGEEERSRTQAAIDDLQRNPRPRGVRKIRGQANYWRLRVGSYRVLYEIDDAAATLTIYRIRHRREAYR
jgi:mRNA interferase RelE/StbE